MPENQAMMMGTTFQINFNNPILTGLAVIGKYDGKHPSLSCGTSGNRIMIHTAKPQKKGSKDEDGPVIQYLSFNQQLTAIDAGQLSRTAGSKKGDSLLIGSSSTIHAFNTETNSDSFYKEVPDGVNAVAFGILGANAAPMTFVGGNCSILGFDAEGNEQYWTVTGDNVTSLAIADWSANKKVLMAASEDNELRIFDQEEVLHALTEVDKIAKIVSSPQMGRYAFIMPNGTVGVYDRLDRSWRYKSKHRPTSVTFCDVDFDGVPELVCGWSNGKVEIRRDRGTAANNGECIFKESYGSSISSVMVADYRQDNRPTPLVCSYDGVATGLVALEVSVDVAVETKEKALLDNLMKERQTLTSDLKTVEMQLDRRQKGEVDANMPSLKTAISCRLRPNVETRSIDLILTTNEGVVRSAVITGDHIFDKNESAFYCPAQAAASLVCSFSLERDIATELSITVMVATSPIDINFQVHDVKIRLPKFSMYVPVKELTKQPQGFAIAQISERSSRYNLWLSNSFNVPMAANADGAFAANFVNIRGGIAVSISASSANGGEFVVRSDSMDLCGDVIQDVATFLGLTEVKATADFPQEFSQFQAVLQRVEAYNAVRMKLTAEMADSTQLVKAFVIKAEDARILNDMRLMKKMYGSLYEVNRELIGEYLKRSNNHNELLAALKDVNNMIQKAGKLRVGQAKTSLVAECRNAIKANNVQTLFSIIRQGSSS